ncbi:microtubule-associated tumor suppressor 1 homolog A isoform X2 [Antennarius striatus]|uniref:microtubule-associated tumor suppressor 1 homolog A isoform X2 n=1 Tax=Antennarius striatus TaxID=241820 RepID=UPI0035B1EF6D
MSKTFNISSDQDVHLVPWTHRDLKLSISSEDHYSNTSLSPSDSSSSISNLSHREANSLDVDFQEVCVSNVDNPLIDLSQRNMLFGERAKLNQTFIATPVSSNVNFWNENGSEMSSHETGYDNNSSFINTEDGCNHSVTSLDSAEKASQLCPCTTPHRGSAENDCCSLSSGEMVLRSNSFCLEEQSHLVVSSLEDSSTSLPAGHQAMLAESNLSTSLLDVCKKSQEIPTENTNHLRLSMTFIQAEVPNEESDKGTSSCLVTLPSESEEGLLMTFVCETQSADCGKDQFASAEPQLLHFPATYTPEQGKTFVSTLSAVQDSNDDVHTSTPIQNVGNKIPSLPSFSESPCTGRMGSSGQHPVKHQQMPDTSNRLTVGLPLSNSKVKKMKIKKFPKSDFSSVKSKVMTRNFHQMSLPDPVSQHKPSKVHVNKGSDAHKGASMRISTGDVKMVNDAQRHVKTGAASMFPAVDGQSANGSCSPPTHQAANKHDSATQSSNVTSETKFSAQQAGNQTFYISSLGNSPDRIGQTNSKPTPKKAMSNKVEARAGSAIGQDKPPVPKTRPRCSSESSLSSQPIKEKKTILRISNSFIVPRPDPNFSQTNLWNQNFSTKTKRVVQDETMNSPDKNSTREFKKISLVKVSNKSKTAGASRDESKSRFRGLLSPKRTGGTPLTHAPAVTPVPAPSSAGQRQATCGRDECRASKDIHTPQLKQKSTPGRQGPLATGKAPLGTTFAASVKPQLSVFLRCTPTRSSVMGHPPTPASKLPCKTQGRPRSLTEVLHVEPGKVSGGTTGRPTLIKSTLAKTRVGATPSKNFGKPAVATSCKTPASTSKGASNLTVTPLKRTPFARCARVTSNAPVDKNKPKASSHQQQASQQNERNGPPDVVPARVTGTGRKDQSIQQLRELLAASNCRFEAIAIVLQQTLAERDEATRQCRALSQELVHLRGELDCSVQSSELLEKEKEELRVALEGALQKLQEQHQKDLVELEQRLQAFYQTEWDKAHLTYQEEANKCRRLMEQQIEEVQSNHEAMKQELKDSHAEQLQCVNLHYELSLEELSKVHNQELQSREKSLKDTESALNGRIETLTAENNVLIEKLTAEENRRKQLAENSQKDAHTLYLEQELESLKVVLDIKNEQLHQQEKKLMEVDTLKDTNVKLNESLNKVQQENEELNARMDKHAALTRQLSTEQAVLQESLQKESKVNKRLSMENEELLWKLQNGDLSCSRRVSPTSTSPSHSFSLQSPCNSSLLSSPPMSPR